MKFLIVLSVFALSASQVTPFFFGHGKKPQQAAAPVAAPAPPPPPPPPPAPAPAPVVSTSSSSSASASSGSSSGGLGGLGSILAIPLGIKKQLLLSHQKKINKHFDTIIGALGSIGGSFGGSSSGASAGASSNGARDFDFGPADENTFTSTSTGSGSSSFESSNGFVQSGNFGGFSGGAQQFDAGSSQSFGSSQSQGGFDTRSGVQTYHPQPAPNVQYKEVPITVHLYQVEVPQAQVGAQTNTRTEVNSIIEEIPQFDQSPVAQFDQVPVAPQRTYGPPSIQSPPPSVQSSLPIAPAPISNHYGPPNHVPSQPVSNYLPPNNCNNPHHRH